MTIRLNKIKYTAISEALEGEIECGDQYLVKELTDFVLVAVVDGLGHGEEAALAAKKAIRTIDAHSNDSLEAILEVCNQELHDTRGAAITIIKVDAEFKLTYMAVGNIAGVCWKMTENSKFIRESFFLQGGIVGARLPSLMRVKELDTMRGDIFVLATDGIKVEFEFAFESPKLLSTDDIAKKIFTKYRNREDDGLVLVVQLL